MGYMITTVDNPYDPRTDLLSWFMWDEGQGYHTSGYLARIAAVADEYPEAIQDKMVETAIDEMVDMHNGKLYKKLYVEDTPTPTSSAA